MVRYLIRIAFSGLIRWMRLLEDNIYSDPSVKNEALITGQCSFEGQRLLD